MNVVLSPSKPARPARRGKWLFTVDRYEQLAEAGVFRPEDRIELIEGEIVPMVAMGSPHAACVDRMDRLFQRFSQDQFSVRAQCPLRLAPHSEPEPDVMLLKLRADFYESRHPGAEDVLLLVEIGDTSIDYDREVKVPLYARHGVAEVWLVDLEERRVEVYREPRPSGYKTMERMEMGERLAPRRIKGVSVAVADVFGKRGK